MATSEIVNPEEWEGDQRQPWDRLDDEPADHFMLFRAYRDQGGRRSIKSIVEITGLSRSRVQPIAIRNSWVVRAEQYDIECARIALKALEGDQTDMRVRHAEIARTLIEKASQAAEMTHPGTMHPRDIPVWLDVAAKLERASKGLLDTKRIEVTGKDGDPIKVVNEMSTDDRRQLMEDARAELDRRLGQRAIDNIIEGDVVEDEEVISSEDEPGDS